MANEDPLKELFDFPLLEAMYGRRARRFGMGMEIPSGPLAFRSSAEPASLTELEHAVLVAAGTGVTGWNFGVPFGPDRPNSHAHYTQRFTGRTAPTAAGFGTPVLFHTDDEGTYLTNTRDSTPTAVRELDDGADDIQRILELGRQRTTQLSDRRLDLPAQPPHMLPPNLWMANAPGSTLFMPLGDASEQVLGFLAMALANGNFIVDDEAGRPAGDLAPFVRSGLLDEAKPSPLSVLQQMAYEANTAELSFMAHNIVLTMQAIGLGGLFFNGLNRWSVLGAFADDGITGLGFRFVDDERWTLPNPVGLDGMYEALCRPTSPICGPRRRCSPSASSAPAALTTPRLRARGRMLPGSRPASILTAMSSSRAWGRSPSTSTTRMVAFRRPTPRWFSPGMCRSYTSTPITTTRTSNRAHTCRPMLSTGRDGTPPTTAADRCRNSMA
ncbi:MAG: hypothetical protein Q8Q52_05640 [Acidimicrobiia bacterium]|nr:hypothetical protein [Acidimicrobiia bacterium]